MGQRSVWALLVTTLVAGTAGAQPQARTEGPPQQPSAGTALTLAQVVRLASERAPAVLVAVERTRVAAIQSDISRANLLPTVSLSSSPSINVSNGNFVVGGGLPSIGQTVVSGQIDATASLRWTVWDFGRTSASIETAESAARATHHDVESARRSAIVSAVSAFYAVSLDRDALEALRASEVLRAQSLLAVTGFVEAGARPEIERIRAEVSLASARVDVANAEVQMRSDLAALAGALGLDPVTTVLVVSPANLAEMDAPALAAARAVTERPEVLASHERVRQAELQANTARRGFWPVLSANASASVRYTERFGQPGSGVSEVGNAGVSLAWPVFDATVRANVRSAEANIAVARMQQAQSELAVRTEAVQAVVAAQSARVVYEQSQVLVRGADANLVQAQGRYELGAGSMLELVDAQTAQAQARTTLARSRWQWEAAKARVWLSLGQYEALR
ncbi:MAG: TolC family protein [Deltaproteobacteria bacterium]|nr:TolC family protein [Deltaproteobacteria bacterium]